MRPARWCVDAIKAMKNHVPISVFRLKDNIDLINITIDIYIYIYLTNVMCQIVYKIFLV